MTSLFLPWLILPAAFGATTAPIDASFFESRVRPTLIQHCFECHGQKNTRGGLRVDSREALLKGGDSGPALIPGKASESLLIQAIQRVDPKRAMPPKATLPAQAIADLVNWVNAGAPWPDYQPVSTRKTPPPSIATPLAPNSQPLGPALQIWLKADGTPWKHGQPVHVWEDSSGRGHDLVATAGARADGTGTPGTFVAKSDIAGFPAVRFGPTTGLGGNAATAPAIQGDAELTLVLVARLRGTQGPPDGLLAGFGEPSGPVNPGKARCAIIGINPQDRGKPVLVGGFGNDAAPTRHAGPPLLDGPPVILSLTRTKGPLASSAQFWINGIPQGEWQGHTAIPDLARRPDLGFFMGHARPWLRGFDGDVAEVILLNRALAAGERQGLEAHLSAKYRIPVTRAGAQKPDDTVATGDPAFQPKHWAFQPIRKPPIPGEPGGQENPIDRFIASGWKSKGLKPVGQADTRALIRRLHFDLTGLPPTPDEMECALAALTPWNDQEWSNLIDRLLNSPRYGERWGRHWLDVARYADTAGDNADYPIPEARLYRDYVIDAFQKDMPYDQFLREQLAGDILAAKNPADRYPDKVAATGFLALSRRYATGPYEFWHLTLEDTIDTVGQAFLGLTLKCARCHDHKFDPPTQNDYYALYGIFESTQFPWAGAEEFQSMKKPREHFVPLVPSDQLAALAERQPKGDKNLDEATRRRGFPTTVPLAYAVQEGTPRPAVFQRSGEPDKPGPVVERGVPAFLSKTPLQIPPGESGRLQLADWLTAPDNPLTARVMVNRIWQHHFGKGLVATPNNFGTRGAFPSHPDLLDWLATTFRQRGWSTKAMHRLILTSKTWRLASAPDPSNSAIDPDNAFLWHRQRQRLDAEAIRDAMLAASGRLNLNRPGEHPFPPITAWGYSQHVQFKEFYPSLHRSVYLMTTRLQRHPFLALFDGPDTNATTGLRTSSIVPAQALYLMNSPEVKTEAGAFAARVLRLPPETRIKQAFQLAWQRPPSEDEEARAKAFIADYHKQGDETAAMTAFCRTLLVSNEFFYLD